MSDLLGRKSQGIMKNTFIKKTDDSKLIIDNKQKLL